LIRILGGMERIYLRLFGFECLRDLPDIEGLEDDGLLSKDRLFAGTFPKALEAAADEEVDGDGAEVA
jgi:segregation and condensation protein B